MAVKKETVKKVAAKPAVVEEPIVEAPKELPIEKSKPVVTVVMSGAFTPIWHPYQRRWVPELKECPEGVEMVMDGWLRSQINAKLVKVID